MNKLTEFLLKDTEMVAKSVNFDELDGKTVLITGATGMVGTYFVSSLINVINKNKLRIKLFAVSHGEPVDYFQELLNYGGADFVNGDLTDYNFCQSLPRADYIIHAAGYAQPNKFLQDQTRTLKINTLTTFYLLNKLNQSGKFLFVSSSEVYSGLTQGPFRESEVGNVGVDHARYCYIEGKRCGEAICIASHGNGVSAKSARLSLAYGPGTRTGDTRVMPSFIERAITQNEISLLDGGEAIRTYCYVADAVKIMLNILFFGKNLVYNVGGQSKITIAELAQKIGNNLNVPVRFPASSASLVGSPNNVSVDMKNYESEFGRMQYVDFDEGLRQTIEWIKSLLNKS